MSLIYPKPSDFGNSCESQQLALQHMLKYDGDLFFRIWYLKRRQKVIRRIEFDAEMNFQCIQIGLPLRQFTHLLRARIDLSESPVEKRYPPLWGWERRHTGGGEE